MNYGATRDPWVDHIHLPSDDINTSELFFFPLFFFSLNLFFIILKKKKKKNLTSLLSIFLVYVTTNCLELTLKIYILRGGSPNTY